MNASDIEFWVTLIKITRSPSSEATEALERNCTHVKGPFWIMEGDTDYLRERGVRFREINEGAVGALGGMTEGELQTVCADSFGVWIP